MEQKKRIRIGLAAKLATALVAGTAAFSVIWGYFNLRELRRHSEAQVLQTAERIADVIRRSTHYEMLHHGRAAGSNAMQRTGTDRDNGNNRILNKEGGMHNSKNG